MLRKSRERWTHVGFLCLTFFVISVTGLIEIVEEQRCHNSKIRLTCRELDAHIAILEAWYTSIDDYHRHSNVTRTHETFNIRVENDTELDRVYVYSSPLHNGVYELMNSSIVENVTDSNNISNEVEDSDPKYLNDSFGVNDTLEALMEFMNASDMCSILTYSRRYARWQNGDMQRRPVIRSTSINLQVPLRNR